jgi:serine protease inhibitor
MRRLAEDANYLEEPSFQAVELPYEGGDFAMIVVLPGLGGAVGAAPSLGSLDAETFARIQAGLTSRDVRLTLPRFTFEVDTAGRGLELLLRPSFVQLQDSVQTRAPAICVRCCCGFSGWLLQ